MVGPNVAVGIRPEQIGLVRMVVKVYDDADVSVGDTVSLDLPVEALHVFAAPESTG